MENPLLLNQPNSKSGQDSVPLGPGRGATRYYDVLSPRRDESKQDAAPTPSHPRIREHAQFFTNEELVEWASTLEGIRKLQEAAAQNCHGVHLYNREREASKWPFLTFTPPFS